jgi:hypothetical protein
MKPTLTPDRSNEIILIVLVVAGMTLGVIGWLRFAFR